MSTFQNKSAIEFFLTRQGKQFMLIVTETFTQ